MNNNKESIGNKISELRKRKGLSVRQLAQLAKVDKSTISDIETGKRSPGIDIVNNILGCMGATLDVVEK